MSNQAFLQDINEKQTSFGTMYDLVFSNGDRVGAGKFKPKGAEVGGYYEYGVTMRGQYKNLTPGSLRKLPTPAGVKPQAAATPARSGGGYQSNDKRQEVISKQAALNSALNFVSLLVAADALPVPKTAKSDKKADLVHDVVMHYTAKYYNLATGEVYEMPEDDTLPFGAADAAPADESWDE